MRKSKGNMYEFVTHTWNPVVGDCSHDCSYCYMKRWKGLGAPRINEKVLAESLGKSNFIFVCSGCDLFADDIPDAWIERVLDKCWLEVEPDVFGDTENRYLFQTKNPKRILDGGWFKHPAIFCHGVICTTLESDIHYPEIMKCSPAPWDRAKAMNELHYHIDKLYVTIEPIMKFTAEFAGMIRHCYPAQVNIGADSCNNKLPEPSEIQIKWLLTQLAAAGIKVHGKENLKRLLI